MSVAREYSTSAITRFDSPSITQVLPVLPEYQIIHFACHGVSDPTVSSNSHLFLFGNDPLQPGPERLTAADVSNMNMKTAQVAYVSACSTADNPSSQLADESIHIASGFQLAGFSHVLTSLWEADDVACRRVSVEFYRRLFARREISGHRVVSTCFHHAVKELRKDMLRQPIKWAAFIHTGA